MVRRRRVADIELPRISRRGRPPDANGHLIGVGGDDRGRAPESDASGSLTNWVVVSGAQFGREWIGLCGPDCPLASDVLCSRDQPPFEGSSFSTDFAAGGTAGATPEPSTWMMMLMGFAGLGVAGYRKSNT